MFLVLIVKLNLDMYSGRYAENSARVKKFEDRINVMNNKLPLVGGLKVSTCTDLYGCFECIY
jgi:hypothetical protein